MAGLRNTVLVPTALIFVCATSGVISQSILDYLDPISSNAANFSERCNPGSLLNPVLCQLKRYTVRCSDVVDGTCECNMGSDSYFDTTLDRCVGKVGSYCTTEAIGLGVKSCTPNADCFPEANHYEGYGIGICECLYGYKTDEETGMCINDDSVDDGDKSTLKPTTTRSPLIPPSQPTTEKLQPPTPPPGNNGVTLTSHFSLLFLTTVIGYLWY